MEKTLSERIRFMKDIKKKHGLSCAQICDIVSHNGEYVAESTVQRVFAKGAEYKSFQYHTIAPIYNAFVATYGEEAIPDDAAELRRFLIERNKRVDELLNQLEKKEEHHQAQVALYEERKGFFTETIDYLKAENQILNDRLTECKRAIEIKDALIEHILAKCMKLEDVFETE